MMISNNFLGIKIYLHFLFCNVFTDIYIYYTLFFMDILRNSEFRIDSLFFRKFINREISRLSILEQTTRYFYYFAYVR